MFPRMSNYQIEISKERILHFPHLSRNCEQFPLKSNTTAECDLFLNVCVQSGSKSLRSQRHHEEYIYLISFRSINNIWTQKLCSFLVPV